MEGHACMAFVTCYIGYIILFLYESTKERFLIFLSESIVASSRGSTKPANIP